MSAQPDYSTLDAAIAELGIEYEADFVPFSKSRNATDKQPSLNWLVYLTKGAVTLRTDYMEGHGHLPKSVVDSRSPNSMWSDERRREACETGRIPRIWTAKLRPPQLRDVLYCLLTDADVLEHACFEDWADCYGLNPDSRKDEATYKQCLEIALKLRQLIGDAAVTRLREAFQDY